MGSKTLILLLSPSGSGKTTRIQERYTDARHINRDGITGKLLESHGLDFHSPDPSVQDQISSVLQREGLPAYYRELHRILTAGRPLVVVDYPPGGGRRWIDETIDRARNAGYGVRLEGLHVEPALGLYRALARNAAEIKQDRFPDFIRASQLAFHSWVETYQKFPEQFQAAAVRADAACLLEGDASGQSPIALWNNGNCVIANQTRFAEFLNNHRLDPESASFTASRKNFGAPVEMTIDNLWENHASAARLQATSPSIFTPN